MKKIALILSLTVLAATFLQAFYTTPAMAQNFHSWVSHSGADGNPCTDNSPCGSFGGASNKTGSGGEISCLDSGSFGALTITQALTIDCNGTLASPAQDDLVDCNAGIIYVNAPGAIVTLRNLTISGFGTGLGCSAIAIQAAAVVNIENCVIESVGLSGISVTTSANTVLNIRNTIIRNVANGISFAPTGGAVNGSIDHTMIAKVSGEGITGNGAAYFTVTNSVISNAASVGVSAGAGTVLEVDSSSVSNNRTGFATSGGIIRISRNVIYDNTANFSISGGTIATSGDNKVSVNGSTVPNGSITQQ